MMNVDSYFKTSFVGNPEDSMVAPIITPPPNLHHSTIMSYTAGSDQVLDAAQIKNLAFLLEACPTDRFEVLRVARWITPKFYQPGSITTSHMDVWGFPQQDENYCELQPGKWSLEQNNQGVDMNKKGSIPAYYAPEAAMPFELTSSTTVAHNQWETPNEDHDQWEARNEDAVTSWIDELFPHIAADETLHKDAGNILGYHVPFHTVAAFFKTTTANECSKPDDESSAEAWLHSLLPNVPDHKSSYILESEDSGKVALGSNKMDMFECGATWTTQTITSGSSTENQDGMPPVVLLKPISDNDIVPVLPDVMDEEDDFMVPSLISVKALDGLVTEASSITDDEDTIMSEDDDTYSFVGSDYSPNTIGYID